MRTSDSRIASDPRWVWLGFWFSTWDENSIVRYMKQFDRYIRLERMRKK